MSQAELTQVLKKISPQMIEVEIATVMKAADLDKDGRISYTEFVDWAFSGQPESEEHKEAQKNAATALQKSDGGGDYPPTGLSANVRKLPAWIQMGCGDTPYICAEKKETFHGDKCPDTMPDFTGYGNFTLLKMEGELKGDYIPLHGSKSYAPKPDGMPEDKEEDLRKTGNLFQEPDSTLLLASGMGRHWPDGRGIFHNDKKNLFVWLNEEDHMRIVSMQGSRSAPSAEGKHIKEVFARFITACNEVQKVLKEEGYDFMHNDHLGWVLTCPSNLGTGLRASTMITLPKLSEREDFKALCGKLGLQPRGTGGVDSASSGGTWDISNADRIGTGEVDLCNKLIEGAAKLTGWEARLESRGHSSSKAEAT